MRRQRPAVLALLALYAAVGAARGGRPLVTGAARRVHLRLVAGLCAAAAPLAALPLGTPAVAVTTAGLAIGAAYSLPPVRIAARGAVASLVLPACYVAVPYLLGLLAARPLRPGDLVLLAGLYAGFVGRILLKDFRDLRGDALFGKRTFLVRHGRRATCAFSAAGWVTGAALLAVATGTGRPAFLLALAAGTAGALALLRALATDGGHRRDERLISATAILGRGLLVVLLAHLSTPSTPLLLGLAALFAGQAAYTARRGPMAGVRVPAQYSRQSRTTARSSLVLVGTSRTRNAAPPR